jgi:hypothetical protein
MAACVRDRQAGAEHSAYPFICCNFLVGCMTWEKNAVKSQQQQQVDSHTKTRWQALLPELVKLSHGPQHPRPTHFILAHAEHESA